MEYNVYYHSTGIFGGFEIQPPMDSTAAVQRLSQAASLEALPRDLDTYSTEELSALRTIYCNRHNKEGTHLIAMSPHGQDFALEHIETFAERIGELLRVEGANEVTVEHRPDWDGEVRG